MSKVISLRTYRIAVIVCALCAGLIGYKVGSGISQAEINQAYERGYEEGRYVTSGLWLKDLENTNEQLREIVDTLRARGLLPLDSTDTLPAVDSVDTVPPEPLYKIIVLDTADDCCAPGIVSFDNFRVSSLNIDRIDTVETSPIASLGHDWYAQDDSTLCRQFGGGYRGFTFPHPWCYLIQVHLKQGRSDGKH